MVVVNGLSVSPGQGMAAPSWTWSASSPSSCSSWRTSCALWPSRPACFAALRVGAGGRTRSLVVRCKAPSLSSDEFEKEVVQSEVPVLVDFWAEWCGPCKLVAPIMDSLAKEYQGKLKVYKIETDSNPSLVEKYKVYGLPTLILFKDGEEVPGGRREGAINKKKLKLLLDELLGTVSTV